MHQLLEKMFFAAFGNPLLDAPPRFRRAGISGRAGWPSPRIPTSCARFFSRAATSARMAVHGTVNDLAMSGARPLYLSAAFILEEGLPMETLWRVVCSMRDAAGRCGVQIVTGDTKVVDKGKGDGLFINTAGIGVIEHAQKIAPAKCPARRRGAGQRRCGPARHGDHGVREGLEFESAIESDSAPVAELALKLLAAGMEVHCLRDLTRGGLASALNEIAEAAGLRITVEENGDSGARGRSCRVRIAGTGSAARRVRGAVCGVCARRRRGAGVGHHARTRSRRRRRHDRHGGADRSPLVILRSAIGAARILDMASGEQLPRIC